MEHSRKQRSKTVCLKSVSQMIGYNIFVVTIVSIHMKCLTGLCSVYASNFVGDTSESREEFNQDIIQWTHSVFLDGEDTRNIRLSWNLMDDNVLLKVEARTKGYVGIGFSKNGRMAGADILIGWVRDQQAFLQDRHGVSQGEPRMDKKQDGNLIAGYENATHTILIFTRKYDTCDRKDVKLTKDTIRIIYAFHEDDPDQENFNLKYDSSRKGSKSVLLSQNSRNQSLQQENEFLHWDLKSHQYQPIIQDGNYGFIHHVLVYECHSGSPSDDAKFEAEVQSDGYQCHRWDLPSILKSCDTLLLVWAIGSEGFFLPENIGHPLDPQLGPKYFKMEIHYDNPYLKRGIRDSSGIRIFYTPKLRPIDAGILSVGIKPFWKHIIPPKQPAVVSYGHCISDCTRQALPPGGIQVFAAVLHAHSMSRKIQLRHIRNGKEMAPIVLDRGFDFNYQEYRVLAAPVRILPGDHLIAECTYDSKRKAEITVGGFATRDEMCLVFIYHYPKIDMPLCHSLPSMPTLLSAAGVTELWDGGMPPRIRYPSAFANRTLSEHLSSYDWAKHFKHYQNATKYGGYEAICGKIHNTSDIDLSGFISSYNYRHGQSAVMKYFESCCGKSANEDTHFFPNVTETYREPNRCKHRQEKPASEKDTNDTVTEVKISTITSEVKNKGSKRHLNGFFLQLNSCGLFSLLLIFTVLIMHK